MKKFLMIISLLITPILFSCGSDDDASSSSNDVTIVGNWQQVSSVEGDGNVLTDTCNVKTTYSFSDNGAITIDSFGNNDVNKDGTETCEKASFKGTYKIADNILTITIDGTGTVVNAKLSANQLNLIDVESRDSVTFKRI